jgi:opacity protein-like surface antigen
MLQGIKHRYFSFSFILISIQTISAQDTTSLRGKNSLLFQIGRNFTLENFNGATFAYEYHQARNTALRFGVTLSGGSNNTDDNEFFTYGDTTIQGTHKQSSFGFSISAQYLMYNEVVNDVAFYFGGGPVFGIGYNEDKQTFPPYMGSNQTDKINNMTLGLSMISGVEWFVTKKISLTAEYGLSFQYGYSEQSNSYAYHISTYKTSSFSLSPATAKLGVAVYF